MTLRRGQGTVEERKEVGREQGLRVAKMVLCRLYGIPRQEQAPLLGTTFRMIMKWMTKYREEVQELEAFARSIMPKPRTGGDMDEEKFKDALRSRFGAQLDVLDRALSCWDTKVAMAAIGEMNKILGLTTKTKVEHEGTIIHKHKIVPAGLKAIDGPRIRRGQPPLLNITPEKSDGASG